MRVSSCTFPASKLSRCLITVVPHTLGRCCPTFSVQKNPRVRKFLCANWKLANSGAGNGGANFYGRLEFLCSFCRKTLHVHKIPRFRGGIWGFGGGSADFIFMGAGIFLICRIFLGAPRPDCFKPAWSFAIVTRKCSFPLFCALCALLWTCVCALFRLFALICVFLRQTAFRMFALGNCRSSGPLLVTLWSIFPFFSWKLLVVCTRFEAIFVNFCQFSPDFSTIFTLVSFGQFESGDAGHKREFLDQRKVGKTTPNTPGFQSWLRAVDPYAAALHLSGMFRRSASLAIPHRKSFSGRYRPSPYPKDPSVLKMLRR